MCACIGFWLGSPGCATLACTPLVPLQVLDGLEAQLTGLAGKLRDLVRPGSNVRATLDAVTTLSGVIGQAVRQGTSPCPYALPARTPFACLRYRFPSTPTPLSMFPGSHQVPKAARVAEVARSILNFVESDGSVVDFVLEFMGRVRTAVHSVTGQGQAATALLSIVQERALEALRGGVSGLQTRLAALAGNATNLLGMSFDGLALQASLVDSLSTRGRLFIGQVSTSTCAFGQWERRVCLCKKEAGKLLVLSRHRFGPNPPFASSNAWGLIMVRCHFAGKNSGTDDTCNTADRCVQL